MVAKQWPAEAELVAACHESTSAVEVARRVGAPVASVRAAMRRYGVASFPSGNRRRRRPVSVCTIEGCDDLAKNRGWCVRHYTRWLRYGDAAVVHRTYAPLQPCVICGSDEKREYGSRRYCSPACEQMGYRYNDRIPDLPPCVTCGGEIERFTWAGRRRRVTARYCYRCSKSPRVYTLSLQEIVARDGSLCGICGVVVDIGLTRKDSFDRCPSIDHIVPRSLGGGHEPANLQLAHLGCNVCKNNRLVV